MSSSDTTIASVTFTMDNPTVLSLEDLYHWVIWQFPRLKESALCAAVHPPLPDFGWIPALIDTNEDEITVFAHLEERYDSPEAAADAVP